MWLGTFSVVVMGSAQLHQDYWSKTAKVLSHICFTGVHRIEQPFEVLPLNMCLWAAFIVYTNNGQSSQVSVDIKTKTGSLPDLTSISKWVGELDRLITC